jgi:hypothetical protein
MSLTFFLANIVAILTVPAQSARKNGQPVATSGYDDAKVAELASDLQENPFLNYPYRACAASGRVSEPSRGPPVARPGGKPFQQSRRHVFLSLFADLRFRFSFLLPAD